MPVVEVEVLDLAANSSNVDVLAGRRAAQIDPTIRAAVVRILAVASATGLTHSLFVGARNPLEVSPVSVSATPQNLIDPDNIVISSAKALPNEFLRLFVNETAGIATNDYRARVIVSEL